jgi:transcriptional regulator with XRE-family HTH domain
MGKQARPRPRHLAAKLLAIRQRLEFSQSEMVRLLKFQMTTARISEYELGVREPNLLVLLAYARAGDVPVERLIDDHLDLYDY